MNYIEKYNMWLESDIIDDNTKEELKLIYNNKDLQNRFYKDLEFGTGGLRGEIGAGSNRMNIYTVGKATQGLSEYLLDKYKDEDISVSIAYDSRIMSENFAKRTAQILCANGIKVNIFNSLTPTPILSYAVRYFKNKAGIVITASHNPKQYNGYKIYGEDGGQITDKSSKKIINFINNIDTFSKIKLIDLQEAEKSGLLNIIDDELNKSYMEKVKSLTIRSELVREKAKDLNIIYTPIHGTGNIPVRKVLKELGYENLKVVKEQEMPDGNFPTVKYPNPEDPEVFKLALSMAKDSGADIIIGTDPDCDRMGVMVRSCDNEYKMLSGNNIGVLLTEYILSSLKEKNILPKNGVIVKTIVTTEMADKIAKDFGIEVINVLTGFKYIGEKIKEFKQKNNKTYIFGFEESYGYLAGDFVRDKDAIIAALLICEMALYYKCKNKSLADALDDLYNKYGFYKEKLISINLEGKDGQDKIANILQHLRHSMKVDLNGLKIISKLDYKIGVEKDLVKLTERSINLPKSNVIKFVLEDKSSFVVRPSGTEPKIKIYLSVVGKDMQDSEDKIENLEKNVMSIIENACS